MQYSQTKEANRKRLIKYATKELADHELTTEQDEGPVHMYYCGKKGTGCYSYRVISAPGMILVYGDVGDYMLQANDRDLIPWLRGAIKSEDYLISKFINKKEVFLADEAEALLDRLVKDAREYSTEPDDLLEETNFVARVRDSWDKNYDGEYEFCKAFCEEGGDSECLESVMDYGPGVYWTVECLKKFVELLDGSDNKSTDEEDTCSSYIAIDE